jgi:nitrite reductase/ring-hydroxylating ferredoxin subunit
MLKLGGAGLAAFTLPSACGQQDASRTTGSAADAGSDASDSESARSQDSAISRPMGDTGTEPPLDGNGPPPADSASATATGDTGTETASDSGIEASTSPCTPNSNTLVVPLAMHPQLGSAGGSVALSDPRYKDPICQDHNFYVVATGPGTFAAFSLSCTLACCTLVIENNSMVRCPCEGATWDLTTGVVTFRAALNLPSIPVCTDGTNLYVQLA